MFTDVISGHRFERLGLAELVDHARPGDRLCVTRPDRLGRSLKELLETVEDLKRSSIHQISLENGYNEWFNGTLRYEVLNPEAFYSWAKAQAGIAQWVHQYNRTRSHQSLNNRPPVPETIAPAHPKELVHMQGV